MSRVNNTRKLVQTMLNNTAFKQKNKIKNVSYEKADDAELFPHIVYDFDTINLDDPHRKDMMLVVDIYDKNDDANPVENIADEIEDMFNAKNLPQDAILPTFYLENRKTVKDEDKRIRHRQIEIIIQNYER